MTANMDGIESSTGSEYYNYGKDQLFRMLGHGDQSRSYVVGFGNNAPQRPHHRSRLAVLAIINTDFEMDERSNCQVLLRIRLAHDASLVDRRISKLFTSQI